jgi:8-oxo-dGTP diphosphatase
VTSEPRVVVGAVIVQAGRVLAARRTRPPDLARYWEFPGGKVEDGEDPRDALTREVAEELGASVAIGDEVVAATGPWTISEKYVLRLYVASLVEGEPKSGADHDALRWLAVDELDSVGWLPSDREALPAVRAIVGPSASKR